MLREVTTDNNAPTYGEAAQLTEKKEKTTQNSALHGACSTFRRLTRRLPTQEWTTQVHGQGAASDHHNYSRAVRDDLGRNVGLALYLNTSFSLESL